MNTQQDYTTLKSILRKIEDNDPSSFTFKGDIEEKQEFYDIRNDLIYEAVYEARRLGLEAGFSVHTPVKEIFEKGWNHRFGVVAYIELPTSQISYHIESPDIQYDGHDRKEKHKRIKKFSKMKVYAT